MKHVLDIEDVDFNFLDQMSDKTLVNFCQTSKYSQLLCRDEIIKDRIENYKYCLSFEITEKNIKSLINQYGLEYPYIIFEKNDDDACDAIIANSSEGFRGIFLRVYTPVSFLPGRKMLDASEFNRVFNLKMNLKINYIIDIDLITRYNIYRKVGCDHETANDKILNHINIQYDKMLGLKSAANYNYLIYFNLEETLLWFKIMCIFLGLTDEDIYNVDEEMDHDFLNSPEYKDIKENMLNDIDRYYDLLIDHFSTDY